MAVVQGGKILAVAACEEAQSVASASSNGSVHVWRVEYTSRSGGAPDRYTGIIGATPYNSFVTIIRMLCRDGCPIMRTHCSCWTKI